MNQIHAAGVKHVGILHPGQMGVTIAAAVGSAGHTVFWASQGRSDETANRANQSGLQDKLTVEALCNDCDFLFSVCPPDQACKVAREVAQTDFDGLYIDCNAVSPVASRNVNDIVSQQGAASYVDGGIIGPPAIRSGTTRLYLSGKSAPAVADLFTGTLVDARVLGPDAGAASALKMAYAGWTKGSAALLMMQFALAREQGVESALLDEWALSQPGLTETLDKACTSSAPKAWRFAGEMREVGTALDACGLPACWFDGAADIYQRLSQLKNKTSIDRDTVIDALLKQLDEST